MRPTLAPQAEVTAAALARGERDLVLDSAFATLTGALSGGVILVAFALAIGAGPFAIGLLAAIPFIGQAAQLPAIAVVERLRRRKRIGVVSISVARAVILALALLPLATFGDARLWLLVAAQGAICVLGSFGACAVNSWLHQLVPREHLGSFFSRRLVWGTAAGCAGTLVAGLLVDAAGQHAMAAYALSFAAAGLAGFISSWFLASAPEPAMPPPSGPRARILEHLRAPLRDANFRRLLVFLGAWNIASNVAAPFVTVFLLKQLGLPLATVTALWVLSQVANALTLYLWGRLSDRLTNKAVLAVALPGWFLCTAALVLADTPAHPHFRLALLVLLHLAMGTTSGGIGLATGNLGLKLAPQGQGTAYLAVVGLVASIAGGIAPLASGAVAEWFGPRQLEVIVRWTSPVRTLSVGVFDFAHWEFLFAISALLGLYVLHALSRVEEGPEVSERFVVQQFGLEALRSLNHVSTVGGLLGAVFPFRRIRERRRRHRLAGEGRPGMPGAG